MRKPPENAGLKFTNGSVQGCGREPFNVKQQYG